MGLFNRIKTWITNEDLASSDLNAEFDNIINHLTSQYLVGDSPTATQMKVQVNPGSVGSESLASSIQGEIERLRFTIARALGLTNWYDTPSISLGSLASLINVGGSTPLNKIVSGRIDANHQPMFLQAGTTLTTFLLKGLSTPFTYYIAGNQVQVITDTISPAMTLAPASNNTALLDGAIGREDSSIKIKTTGSSITALIGQWAAFKVDSEVFIGYVASSTSITKCLRNFVFDGTDAVVPSATHSDGATVTLFKLGFVYVDSSGVIQIGYTKPNYSGVAPTSPSSGDYWFDFSVGLWKTFNGSSWILSNSTLIGMAIADTAHCLYTRSLDFYASYSNLNTVGVEIADNTDIVSCRNGFEISVYGKYFNSAIGQFKWNSATNMETGSVADFSLYYLYIADTGIGYLSLTAPISRNHDLRGFYHPSKPWRCVGDCQTDGSSNFSYVSSNILVGQKVINGAFTSTAETSAGKFSVVVDGGPVIISFGPVNGSGVTSSLNFAGTGGSATINLYRDGNNIGSASVTSVSGSTAYLTPSIVFKDDAAEPGWHTYELKIQIVTNGTLNVGQMGLWISGGVAKL